jgi:hypothetical protein
LADYFASGYVLNELQFGHCASLLFLSINSSLVISFVILEGFKRFYCKFPLAFSAFPGEPNPCRTFRALYFMKDKKFTKLKSKIFPEGGHIPRREEAARWFVEEVINKKGIHK